jgi:hypothetical protein
MKNHSRLTTERRATLPLAPPPPGSPPASPLLLWALAATLAVLVGLFGSLFLTGRLHFGPRPAATPTEEKKPSEEAGGRYQIELVEDSSHLWDSAGNLGFLGDSTQEVWVFRYSGGLLECAIEAETAGQAARGQAVPESWSRLVEGNEDLKKQADGRIRKDGYIVLAAMRPAMPVDQALAAYHTHLGGLFVAGPAGPLHQATNVHLDSSHWRAYRLLLNAGPPKGEKGAGFNLWTGQEVNVRLPLVARDLREEEFRVGGGKDLVPDQEVTLLERRRGMSTVRLKARFLSDGKADEVLNAAK